MIKQLIIHGYKDQHRKTVFSGMDLFTSDDVNGVGKSSVLEAVKLALLGEIPGKAKTLEDLLQFTSCSEMSVKIVATRDSKEIIAERRFLRNAEKGEKRPIIIDQFFRKYEDGDQWIRDTFGAVSIGFDPYEFLNLTSQKKRQWIISHSPESRELGREVLYALLFARMAENQFGKGLVREQALALGMQGLEDVFDRCPAGAANRLVSNLSEIVQRQDSAWVFRTRSVLDKFFSLWSDSCSQGLDQDNRIVPACLTAEENIASMLTGLKAEIARLKNVVRERTMTISCLGRTDAVALSGKVENCRDTIQLLGKAVEDLDLRIETSKQKRAAQQRRQERLKFLEDNIAILAPKSGEGLSSAEKLQELRMVDTRGLQEELERLDAELSIFSENFRRQETSFDLISRDLKLKQGKLESLFRMNEPLAVAGLNADNCRQMEGFHCPVAVEIRCETDMKPYQDLLVREIAVMEQKANEARFAMEKARKDLRVRGERFRGLQSHVKSQTQINESLRQEMRALQEKIMAEELLRAEAQGKLDAYREEMKGLNGELIDERTGFEPFDKEASNDVLESKKQGLMAIKKNEEINLESLLREQGRAEAVAEMFCEKSRLELELKDAQALAGLLGPDGIQGEMAARIASALQKEVNEALKLIDANFDFALDLSGTRFVMGWNRDGKVIPFETINSAHFILFIVPFLAALLKRMGRIREREGLPMLKVLCIEAESMTGKNLVALLRGLSVMKAKGYLDNVLVAHYTSIRDPQKLSGFKEHVLTEKGEAGL